MKPFVNLIAISYAKRALEPGSREQQRMEAYAETIPGSFVVIVCTTTRDAVPACYQHKNLTILGTHTKTKIGMVIEAYRLARRYIYTRADAATWLLTTQDPFETAAIGRFVTLRTGVRHHVQVHGDQFLNPRWLNATWFNRIRVVFGKHVMRHACGIRVVSARAKRALITLGIPDERITVLPIQSQLEQFIAVGKLRTYTPQETTMFLYVGRLSPEKNIDRIIRVFAQAYKKNASIRLTILGGGSELARLTTVATQWSVSSAVTFLPWSNNVAEVLADADVLVLASSHEGYAMVIVEAMAAGLPVITTDVGCVGEVMYDGQHGIVVPFTPDQPFVSAMDQLTDPTLRARYGKAAHSAVVEKQQTEAAYLVAWKDSFCT